MGRDLIFRPSVGLAAIAFAQAVHAQDLESLPAAGGAIFYSSDSDATEIVRTAIDFDLRNERDDRRLGVRLEKAWYDPAGTGIRERERIFLQAADIAGNWNWKARVGTDGDTIIGSVSAHDNSSFRKEVFLERDIVETRQGLDRGIYSTFGGAAIDIPLDERNVFTVLAGVQAFAGDNTRVHLRGNYVHVLKPEWGLSAQLRGRYFHSSNPGEFDYYSPRWYAQILPVAQLRRFVGGWELVGAAGTGVQRDASSDWRQSHYAHLRFRSPRSSENWSVHGEITYTDAPSDSAGIGEGYSYLQTRLRLTRRF